MSVSAIFLSIVAATTPIAPAPSGAPRMIVHAEDLDLMSQCGADALRRRVDQAVLTMAGDQKTATGSFLPNPKIGAARIAARRQADAMIAAARDREPTVAAVRSAKALTPDQRSAERMSTSEGSALPSNVGFGTTRSSPAG